MLDQFLFDRYLAIDGQSTPFGAFCNEFRNWLFSRGVNPASYTDAHIRDELEKRNYPVGQSHGLVIGNLVSRHPGKRWVRKGRWDLRLQSV